jgi:hypothetical protein
MTSNFERNYTVSIKTSLQPILVVLALPALRRAPPERCGGRPLVQVTHDAGTIAALSTGDDP